MFTTLDALILPRCTTCHAPQSRSNLLSDRSVLTETFKHQIMRNLGVILVEAMSSLNDVVEVTVFLTNIADADVLSPAYKTYWGDLMPART